VQALRAYQARRVRRGPCVFLSAARKQFRPVTPQSALAESRSCGIECVLLDAQCSQPQDSATCRLIPKRSLQESFQKESV